MKKTRKLCKKHDFGSYVGKDKKMVIRLWRWRKTSECAKLCVLENRHECELGDWTCSWILVIVINFSFTPLVAIKEDEQCIVR